MPTYPAARLLVSADPPTPSDDLTVVRTTLANGLPAFVDLTKVLRLKLTLPTGLMQPWLRADPTTLVSTSDDEMQARPNASDIAAPALRLSIVRGGSTLASLPATVGAARRLPDTGDPAIGAAVEIQVLSWKIFAGTLRGAGDFGSYIQFGWKPADQAVSDFGPPVINLHLQLRLIPRLKLQSQLGLRKLIIDSRFAVRRWPLYVEH